MFLIHSFFLYILDRIRIFLCCIRHASDRREDIVFPHRKVLCIPRSIYMNHQGGTDRLLYIFLNIEGFYTHFHIDIFLLCIYHEMNSHSDRIVIHSEGHKNFHCIYIYCCLYIYRYYCIYYYHKML